MKSQTKCFSNETFIYNKFEKVYLHFQEQKSTIQVLSRMWV